MGREKNLFVFLGLLSLLWARSLYAVPGNENAVMAMGKAIAQKIGGESPAWSPIALEAFTDSSKSDLGRQLATICQRVVREALLKQPSLTLVENERVDSILNNLELQLSGVFDPSKTAAVGSLIGAKFLGIGDITEEPDGYRFVFRMVELSTGKIVYESGDTFQLGSAKEIVKFYAPPGYRLTGGLIWQDFLLSSPISIGGQLGFIWYVSPDDVLSATAVVRGYPFGVGAAAAFYIVNNGRANGPAGGYYTYQAYLQYHMEYDVSVGYGRSIKLSPFFLVRPEISAGLAYTTFLSSAGWTQYDAGNSIVTYGDTGGNDFQISPYLEAGFAVVLSNDAPLGFFVNCGFDYFFMPISGGISLPDGTTSVHKTIDWDAKASMGIQFHL
jgi:hypothetical protein